MLWTIWRVALALGVRTAFDPDEYWQAPEVAHRIVFGYGHLTWEWARALRSYLHPLLFVPGYALLRAFAADTPRLVQLAPRLTQAAIAVAHDAATFAFARAHLPPRLTAAVLLISATSWFNCYTLARPLSNSAESALHLLCLALWPPACLPWERRRARRAAAVALAGACCALRPPSAVLFVPLALWEAGTPKAAPRGGQRHGGRRGKWLQAEQAAIFLLDGAAIALGVAAVTAALDRAMYGRWVFPPLESLRFNVIENGSAGYGTHAWHWYFAQGVPAMLASYLPLVVLGAAGVVARRARGLTSRRKAIGRTTSEAPAAVPLWPLCLALWGIAVHSVLPHKEFRFVLPSVQLLLLYAAVPLEAAAWPPSLALRGIQGLTGTTAQLKPLFARRRPPPSSGGQPLRRARAPLTAAAGARDPQRSAAAAPPAAAEAAPAPWPCAALIDAAFLMQIGLLVFFGTVHQRGPVAVAEWLAAEHLPPGSHVVFLTPCHATPWQAHIHNPAATLTFLDCSPEGLHRATIGHNAPLATGVFHVADAEAAPGPGGARDEQRAFEAAPLDALCRAFGCRGGDDEDGSGRRGAAAGLAPPGHVVLFDELEASVRPFLDGHGYRLARCFLHTPFPHRNVCVWVIGRRGASQRQRARARRSDNRAQARALAGGAEDL